MINKICVFSILLLILFSTAVFGQAHGIPTSIRELASSGEYLPVSDDLFRFKTGGYFSASNRFYLVNHDLVKPSTYKDYYRYGMFFEIDKRFKDSVIGLSVPVTRSESYRAKGYYPVGDYVLERIGDIALKAGWSPYFTDKTMLYSELKVEIASQKNRAFTDPYMYIGNDGHYALTGKIAVNKIFSKTFNMFADVTYVNRLPKTRTIFEGARALAVTSNAEDEVKAKLDLRDYVICLLAGTYKSNSMSYSLGYEWFYETKDRVSSIQNSDPVVKNAVKTSVGDEDAFVNSIIGSVGCDINEKSKLSVIAKIPFYGCYAYNEKIFSLIWETDF